MQTEVRKMISNSIKHNRLHPSICVLFRDVRKWELYDYTKYL